MIGGGARNVILLLQASVLPFSLWTLAINGQHSAAESSTAAAVGALLKLIGTSLKVTAFVECWDEDERLEFAKISLQSGQHFWQFVSSKDAPVGENGDRKDALNQWYSTLDADIESHQSLVLVDLRCNQSMRLLREAGQRLYLNYRWLVMDSRRIDGNVVPNSSEHTLDVLRDLPVLVSSEIFVMVRDDDGSLNFMQVYKVSKDAELRTENYAVWRSNSTNGGKMTDLRVQKVTSVRRKNLYDHFLRASMVITNPDTINHLTDYKDKHIDTITKVNYILTNYLVAYLGARVNYSRVSTWGYYNSSTGMWDGMIGELVHNTADLGASPLFFTTDRIAVIEYIAMTSETRSKFIFRSPKLSYTDNVFVLPFDDKVWCCVIAVIVVSAFLLLVTLWVEWKIKSRSGNKPTQTPADGSVMPVSLRDTLLMMYGASCQQGSSVLPRSFSARTITMLSFTVLMFLYASYSANIVALLQSPSRKIQTLDDLLTSRLKFGVHDTVFNRHYFTHATERTRRALYEQKIRRPYGPDAFIALEQGIERIRHGLYAFHVEQGVGYKVISETYQEDEKCGLQEIQYLQVIDPYYAIQKNSSYKEMIKIGLFRLNEHGIQYRENAKLYTKKPTCSGGGGKFVSVSLVDVEPAVWIILWGGGLAVGFFVVELIYSRALPRLMKGRTE
ncbi:ionotropic receptor 75a-like [Anopheles nili]|uniref:ionotropic receptor 75a-like n=1 Tax=Anopheles nili TaxID=185578 RepID=UPI00237B6947|nr:ionotropic receptor 75a-like [Anopheles nili]